MKEVEKIKMGEKYDFSGWATKNNIVCGDNRVILKNAFKENDGDIVPLVWMHQHNSPDNVLGHALLENRDEGVYMYGTFNDTPIGQHAKSLVKNGDVKSLSIYANKLKQDGQKVVHGSIREVSLVLAGANPGAFIDYVISHGETSDEEAVIYTDEEIDIYHSENHENKEEIEHSEKDDEMTKTVGDVISTFNDEQVSAVERIVNLITGVQPEELSHAEEKTVQDVLDGMTEEQRNVVFALIGLAVEQAEASNKEVAQSAFEEDDEEFDNQGEEMKHNVFDIEEETNNDALMHDAMNTILADAKRYGSVKDSYLAHAEEYGIDNIEYLFPEDHVLDPTPQFIARRTEWVADVMNSVRHTPFSRIKSRFADITENEARAKGYIKGNLKKEEVFSLLKRSTAPTTVYKKQKMDRDDVIDITDFDVVAWLKTEMRGMLDEEIARAILIGDGRLASDDDHIDANCIRPIVSDSDLFVIRWGVANGSSADEKAKNFIKGCIKARKNYRGSGNPVLFTTEDMLTDMLLIEDSLGYSLYKTQSELETKLRVSKIVTVPVLEGFEVSGKDIHGIIVNLNDYTVGADKGGEVNMFDDFDIDFNQQKYLIETRCSGALTKPFSAIVLKEADTNGSLELTLAEAKAQLS